MTIKLADALRRTLDNMPGLLPFTGAILLQGSGPPTDTTSTDCLFYCDTDTDACYFNQDRAGSWAQVADASLLSPGESILTATT
jgi:hypothetical protein